ncbi:MAG: hypothetical protein R3B74_10105 [Nitrospirales bacterium]|nr:hypothetical protein [Nitrospirales bacterium]
MKYFAIFLAMGLGLAVSVQPGFSEDNPATGSEVSESAVAGEATLEGTGQEDLPAVEEGQEGEVTERGVRRFKLPQKKVPLKPRPKIIIPKPDQPVGMPPSGGSGKPPAGAGTPPAEPLVPVQPPQCVWQTSDIIDQRIDISAQQRLMTMMSRGGEERLDASAMIGAVKQGSLAGILLSSRKAVSDRGQRMTPPKGWWDLIPQGQLGTCLQEPTGEPPMMLYRDTQGEVTLDPSVIDHTLRTVWRQCGLPTPVPACSYLVDLQKPPSPPDPTNPTSVEHGELLVFVKGNGNPLAGVQVSVRAQSQTQPGQDQGTTFLLTQMTNGNGLAGFHIPPVQNRISVQISGPPGFLSHLSEFGFSPKATKGIMVELMPINSQAP